MSFYPDTIPTILDLHDLVNNLNTTLNGAIDAVQTTITLTSVTNFPTRGAVTIGVERIAYTGISSNDLTGCTRGFGGTAASTHDDLSQVEQTYGKEYHNDLRDEIIAIETDLPNYDKSNLAFNSGFEIWRRGVTFVNPANGVFTSDGWEVNAVGDPTLGTYSILRTLVTPPEKRSQYSLRFDVTSIGTATEFRIRQLMEEAQFREGVDTITARCRIRVAGTANASNHASVALFANATITRSAPIPADSAWHTVEVTITNTSGPIEIFLYGEFSNATITNIDNLTVVYGSAGKTFVPEHHAAERHRAHRYFENYLNYIWAAVGRDTGTNFLINAPIKFAAQKAAIPIITTTLLLVLEEGSPTDQKGSYTSNAGNISRDGFTFTAFKAIAGAKPSDVRFDWEAEG